LVFLFSSCDQTVERRQTYKSLLKQCNAKCQEKFKVDAVGLVLFNNCECKADE
jgi:hypothetical protein